MIFFWKQSPENKIAKKLDVSGKTSNRIVMFVVNIWKK